MKEEIKNATILEKTVRRENGKILNQVQDDMVVQGDMEVYGHCERMRSNPANYLARSADKNLSLFTSHLSPSHFSQRRAFTLAEVLITLGIIGVVAAMTMPSLIQNYKKKVVTVRLKHFASMYRQAYQLSNFEHSGILSCSVNNSDMGIGPDDAMKCYEDYFMPYIKTVNLEKSQCGVIATFSNGSAVYMYGRNGYNINNKDTWLNYLLFCPHYNDCKKLNLGCGISGENYTDGKSVFLFYNNGSTPSYELSAHNDYSREYLLELCGKKLRGYCSTLIEYDGWEIKDDYPW